MGAPRRLDFNNAISHEQSARCVNIYSQCAQTGSRHLRPYSVASIIVGDLIGPQAAYLVLFRVYTMCIS